MVVILAWSTSPDATGLERHVQARLQSTSGTPVPFDRVAPWLRDAVVATEDERFYRHRGIDGVGVLRALPYDLVHLSFAQGASTITEQVAKVLYLNGNDHSPWRKLEDAAIAVKLEGRYDKEQILGAYLNSVYFGEGAYGVWRASRRYFGVSPLDLDLAQASMLAGLIQAPSAYDPLRHPAPARARQVEVLRAMVANGFTTDEEATVALGSSLRLHGGATLPPLRGVDLSPGPAFVWWQLALGGGDGARRCGRAACFAPAPFPGRSRLRRCPGSPRCGLPSRRRCRGPILPHRLKSTRLLVVESGWNPRRAFALAVFTARYRRTLVRAVRLSREASRVATAARRPGVRREAHAASVSLGQAVERAREIGMARAVTDEKLARLLNRTLDHASSSVAELRYEKPKHRLRRIVLATLGLVGVVVALRAVKDGRPSQPI